MEIFDAFLADIKASAFWVYWWVGFMGVVLSFAVVFAFTRVEARWTLAAMAATVPLMMFIYHQVGYQRLLGLPHILFWTPLVIWLWQRRDRWRVRQTLGGKWVLVLFIMMVISLVIDYSDVVRYLMGERL